MYSFGINCHNTMLPPVNITYTTKTITKQMLDNTINNISNNWRPTGFLRKNEYLITHMTRNIDIYINESMQEANICDEAANIKSKLAKNLIDKYSKNHMWDKTKILTNPYEFIYFTSRKYLPLDIKPISLLDPLSRSFFKMVEMSNTGLQKQLKNPDPLTTLHLAEGPGGFIEAIIYLRAKYMKQYELNPQLVNKIYDIDDDLFYGITLLDKRRFEVPSWKKSQYFISANPQLKILTGVDGTGNLYNISTLRALCCKFSVPDKYGNTRRPLIITGDGGFDFSVNHALQEYKASKLILAQVIAAMLTLAKSPDSVFICKFFDLHLQITMEIIYILQSRFRKIYIFKPHTSRLANSEKYIICEGYLGCTDGADGYINRLEAMAPFLTVLEEWNNIDKQHQNISNNIIKYCKLNTNKTCTPPMEFDDNMSYTIQNINHILEPGVLPNGFINFIRKINGEIVKKQEENIKYTIDIIEGKQQLPEKWCQHMITTAIKWCNYNNIPVAKKYRPRP